MTRKTNIASLLLLASFFFYTLQGISQVRVTGEVLEKQNAPIASATVVLLDSAQTVLAGTTTDKVGKFDITHTASGKYTLKISHVGFKNYLKKIEGNVDLGTIQLMANHLLKEVSVVAKPTLSPQTKGGKHIVNVLETTFTTTENVWEGLKQVPMLSTSEHSLKVLNKNAIIEMDGVQTQMVAEDLQDYLMSLSPNTIASIEINPNPDASYGTEVDAVINLITQQTELNDYRVGLKTSNGLRSNYFNNDNVNLTLNSKKVRLYSNYSFNYLNLTNESKIEQRINDRSSSIDYKDSELVKKHHFLLNVNFKLGTKDVVDLTQILRYRDKDLSGKNNGENFSKNIDLKSTNTLIQLAQIWKRKVNDSTSFELGFYEVFKDYQTKNLSELNSVPDLTQRITSNIPLWIGFFNYSFSNPWGQMKIGIKYNDITVTNDNETILNSETSNSPFNYNERVFSSYINQTITFSPVKSLSFGLRLENSFIDYSFSNILKGETTSNDLTYSNLLYNISYNWYSVSSGWFGALAFRKQISRPNYSYLNPFQSINTDVTLFAGDLGMIPQKAHSLLYHTGNQTWVLYSQIALFNDFISTVVGLENNTLIQTYRNFDRLYVGTLGSQYNTAFFNDYWTTKNHLNVSFVKLDDLDFNENLKPTTPIVNFGTTNNVKLGEAFYLGVNYEIAPTFDDGVYRHFLAHQLDLTLSKKIKNFRVSFFAKDVLKTQYQADKISASNFSYHSRYYFDTMSFGLTLNWSVTGDDYTKRRIAKPVDDSINRLKS